MPKGTRTIAGRRSAGCRDENAVRLRTRRNNNAIDPISSIVIRWRLPTAREPRRDRRRDRDTKSEAQLHEGVAPTGTHKLSQQQTNRCEGRYQEAQAERATANTDDATRAGGSRGASTTSDRAAGTACACNVQARKQRDEVVSRETTGRSMSRR